MRVEAQPVRVKAGFHESAPAANAGEGLSTEHIFQEIGNSGRGVRADFFLFLAYDKKQTIDRARYDVRIDVEDDTL